MFDSTHVSFLLPLVVLVSTVAPAPDVSQHHHHQWQTFDQLVDAKKGMINVTGMSKLKHYLYRFGYLLNYSTDVVPTFTDDFDDSLETAVALYQSKLGLNVSGELDSLTIAEMTSPRCGVSDHTLAATGGAIKHYAFFQGRPSWSTKRRPFTLTYAFSPTNSIHYIEEADIKEVFRRSFSRWAAAIPVRFKEATNYSKSNIRIGFYSGNHGDGEAFDGVLGILAHAFSPKNGRLHLDKAETWAVDLGKERSKNAIDLESVATHEIGHVLGLAHSKIKDSVMYPSLGRRTRRVDLSIDDVQGVQTLYGSNPDFKFGSLNQAERSSSPSLLPPIWSFVVVAMAATAASLPTAKLVI